MPLPAPAPRRATHTRTLSFQGFARDDGLWDIEGRLVDRKPFDFRTHRGSVVAAETAIHDISIRLTLDDERRVVAVAASTDSIPFETCPRAADSLQALVGATIEAGWRRAIRDRLPMRESCTHMRELLVAMGTAALQAMSFGRNIEGTPGSQDRPSRQSEMPYYIDQCLSWRRDGPVVRDVFPLLAIDPRAPD